MRIYFDGNGTALAPGLRGDIAERLEALNAPYEDISEACVTLKQLVILQEPHQEARLELLLGGRTLYTTKAGTTAHDAANTALHDITSQLQAFRILRPRGRATPSASPSTPNPSCGQQEVGDHEDRYRLAQAV